MTGNQGPQFKGKGTGVKPHDLKYIYKGLWRYLSHYKVLLLSAVVLTVVSSILNISGTSLAGNAIGAIAGESDRSVYYYLVLMVIFYITSSALSYTLSMVMLRLSQKMVHKMRQDIYDKLVILPVGFFDHKQAGEIVSIVSYDVNTVNESLTNDFLQIITSFATIVTSFVLMLTVSPILILVFLITIPLSVIFTSVITRIVRPLYKRRSATLGEMNGYIEEMISGHKTIKSYGAEKSIIQGFEKKNKAAADAYTDADSKGSYTGPTVNFINNLSLALVNIFGALLYMMGGRFALTLTGLSKFVLLSRKFSGPINQISNIYADIQSALAASERVFRLIDEEPEIPDSKDSEVLDSVKGDVELSHVSFGYSKDKIILNDLSFHATPGSVTAIVGPTGAGKTTIINLLMRFYDINSGKITVDGKDIYKVTRDSLRRAYTMVLQETWLFHGTIFENVAYGREGTTREDVIEACKSAKIHNYIMSLENGYDTVISEQGSNISKGQKQLLTIARAMLIDSSMLILDEATSNVDSKTEKDISDAMVKLMKNKTCFVIAHRLSTIRNADCILVVKDGDVIERGTHDELLQKGGFYSELYNSQFETN